MVNNEILYPHQYAVYLINLDPTMGQEIRKTRPCVIISPDEINEYLDTVIIAPMTTKSHDYPTRTKLQFAGKVGWIVVDQIRTIDKRRLIKYLGHLEKLTIHSLKATLQEMLIA